MAERIARERYGKLVAILAAQDRNIAAAEDALSEALTAALRTWPLQGVPANPEAWLLTAAATPLAPQDVARAFKGKRAATVRPVLDALAGIGMARRLNDGRYAA